MKFLAKAQGSVLPALPVGFASRWLLHSFAWIPGALLFAHKHDLPDMIGVVRADMRDRWSDSFQLRVVRAFDDLLEFRQDGVKLLHCGVPAFGVKLVEGFVVVAAEFLGRFAFDSLQVAPVPENQVIRQLADGVIPLTVSSVRLLRC